MQIRLAELSDYEKLMMLYNLFVEEDRFSKHNNDSFHEVMKRTDYFVYVAEENDRLIGLMTFSTRSVVRYPRPIAQLEELFVLEEFRNLGLGKKFIEEMEIKAKELKCCNIYIESRNDKKIAHQVYQRLGYKLDGFYFKKII